MSEVIMMATIAISGIDAALAATLLGIYLRLYRRLRAPFTAGLAAFAGFFLAQNLVAITSFVSVLSLIPDGLAPLLLVIGLLEMGGLGFLLRTASS